MKNRIIVKKVDMSSIKVFMAILIEAAEWLISENMKNWDPLNLSIENIIKKNDLDELYLCYSGDEAVGCFIMQTMDTMFWPEAPEGEALYIHKLALKRRFAGRGLSGTMIDWVKEQATRKMIKFVRLDCIANRDGLCRLYERQGFVKIDEKQVFGQYPSARYEYKIGD